MKMNGERPMKRRKLNNYINNSRKRARSVDDDNYDKIIDPEILKQLIKKVLTEMMIEKPFSGQCSYIS